MSSKSWPFFFLPILTFSEGLSVCPFSFLCVNFYSFFLFHPLSLSYSLCHVSLPLSPELFPLPFFTSALLKVNLTWGNSDPCLIYYCSFMSALCLFLANKSITTCPPSFSVEVQRDGFTGKESCTVHIESEKKRQGTRQHRTIECWWNMYTVNKKTNY